MSDQGIIKSAYRVSGRVQGVGFRWSTQNKANELGLAGWVRNLHNGDVEVMAGGHPEAVSDLERWLHRGPTFARVNGVEKVHVTDQVELSKPFTIK